MSAQICRLALTFSNSGQLLQTVNWGKNLVKSRVVYFNFGLTHSSVTYKSDNQIQLPKLDLWILRIHNHVFIKPLLCERKSPGQVYALQTFSYLIFTFVTDIMVQGDIHNYCCKKKQWLKLSF